MAIFFKNQSNPLQPNFSVSPITDKREDKKDSLAAADKMPVSTTAEKVAKLEKEVEAIREFFDRE